MWKSQDDIVKDLASLNDFDTPGDVEPYKVLYSIGRGSKIKDQRRFKKSKSSEKFLDSRTGEVIDIEDDVTDNDNHSFKGRGRASLLGGFSRSRFQLQQQLRLARPLGSGDEAIESYCRRNQPVESSKISTGTHESESDSKSGQFDEEILNVNLNSDKMKHRIKAIRNSSKESNALIAGLLSKSKENSGIKLTNNEESLPKIFNLNNDSVNCSESNRTERGSLNSVDQTLNATIQNAAHDGLNCDKEGEEQRNKDLNKVEENKYDTEESLLDYTKEQQNRDEKYRLLGEKLNRLRNIHPKISENGMYAFSEISRCISSIKVDSNMSSVAVTEPGSVPNYFVVNDEDFPPLGK